MALPTKLDTRIAGPANVLPALKLERVAYEGLVHLVQGWWIYDTDRQPGKSTRLKTLNVEPEARDGTLCRIMFPANVTMQATRAATTCVACLAKLLAGANYVLEGDG